MNQDFSRAALIGLTYLFVSVALIFKAEQSSTLIQQINIGIIVAVLLYIASLLKQILQKLSEANKGE